MIFSRKIKQHQGKVGGLFYFFSLISVIVLAALSTRFFLQFYFTTASSKNINLLEYFGFLCLGFIFAAVISGKISVFIHELKHSVISSLAGNKSKGMSYQDNTGQFEYTYTKDTAHLNAFISLAPYTLPIFSIIALGFYFFLIKTHLFLASVAVVFALGVDLILNLKDAGIHQTDLTEIRGGYSLSIIYVLSFNLALVSLVSLISFFGISVLADFIFWLAENFYSIAKR